MMMEVEPSGSASVAVASRAGSPQPKTPPASSHSLSRGQGLQRRPSPLGAVNQWTPLHSKSTTNAMGKQHSSVRLLESSKKEWLHSQSVRSPTRFAHPSLGDVQSMCSEDYGSPSYYGSSGMMLTRQATGNLTVSHLRKSANQGSLLHQGTRGIGTPAGPARSRLWRERDRLRKARMPPRVFDSRLKTVIQVQKQVRNLTGQIANMWGWTGSNTKPASGVMPALARVHSGNGATHVVPGYLLQDLDGCIVEHDFKGSADTLGTKITNASIQEVHLVASTDHFEDISVLIKLRWLLRLQSACCEIDYKVLSWKEIFCGMQFLALQQHTPVSADNLFDTKVSQHVGAHLNLVAMLDDIADQLQRSLSGSWQGFLEYIATCDPLNSLYQSMMDSRLKEPEVTQNDSLAVVLDTVFLAYFLRRPRKSGATLKTLFQDLEALGIALPAVPPLRGAKNLLRWARCQLGLSTQQERAEAASTRDLEKMSQLEAVLLTAAVELHMPSILADSHDPEDGEPANPSASQPSLSTEPPPSPHLHEGASSQHGSANAKVSYTSKPIIQRQLYEAATHVVNFHATFPTGIRERLHDLLVEEYALTQKQLWRLTKGTSQSTSGPRLTHSELYNMEQKEKTRLRMYHVSHASDTSHLLAPSLVPVEAEIGRPAKYTTWTPPRSAPASLQLSASAPNLHASTWEPRQDSREPFKVDKSTGPLTWSEELSKLRTTGYFHRMPPL